MNVLLSVTWVSYLFTNKDIMYFLNSEADIRAKLLELKGEDMTNKCQKIWNSKEWPTERTQTLVIPLQRMGTSANIGATQP